jgi:hypothetical protein
MNKNKYYEEIDKVLKEYEFFHPYPAKALDWVADRIDWAWKWRKISEKEMIELAGRATKLFER